MHEFMNVATASSSDGDGTGFSPEFNKRAWKIRVGIHQTWINLVKLANLAMRTGFFHDPTVEIQELTAVIEQDITALNAAVVDFNLQNESGNISSAVDNLKNLLMSATKEFKNVLTMQTGELLAKLCFHTNLKSNENRRQLFSSSQLFSRKSADGESQPLLQQQQQNQQQQHRRSLPQEIVSKILIELPAKSVMRFSSVSKTWLSIIKDPYFIKSHHARSYTRPGGISLMVIKRRTDGRDDVFYTHPEGKSPLKLLTPPSSVALSDDLSELHSAHGLLCVENCIWNPTNNESVVLPAISLTISIEGDISKYTYIPEYYLGLDSSNSIYKVLCALQIEHGRKLISRNETRSTTWVFKILELGGSSWRDIESVPSQLVYAFNVVEDSFSIPISIENMIYFAFSKYIVAFDVRCEKFELIPFPDGLLYDKYYSHHMIQIGECIYLINEEVETMWKLEDFKKHQWSESLDLMGPWLKVMKSNHMGVEPVGAIHTNEILLRIFDGLLIGERKEVYYYYDIDSKIGRMVPELAPIIPIHPSTFTSFRKHVESIYRLK